MLPKRSALTIVMTALALAATAFAQRTTLTFQVGGKTRVCNVHVPKDISNPPLVFFVHGAGGHANYFEDFTKGNTVADREKFIAAYPGAASQPGEKGTWEDMGGTGNYPFFKAVIDTLDARYKIDRKRIYMTGFSQGGFISFAMACNYSDVFAAIAPASGHSPATCAPKRPVPVFMTWGALEGTSFLKDRDQWLKLDNCPATQKITKPFPASNPNSKATLMSYGPCDGGTAVWADSISDQAHLWPAASNMNMAEEVWKFFKPYSLGTATGIDSRNPVASRPSFSVTYSGGFLRLEGVDRESRVTITDTRGQLVATSPARSSLAFAGKAKGVYLISVGGKDGTRARKFALP